MAFDGCDQPVAQWCARELWIVREAISRMARREDVPEAAAAWGGSVMPQAVDEAGFRGQLVQQRSRSGRAAARSGHAHQAQPEPAGVHQLLVGPWPRRRRSRRCRKRRRGQHLPAVGTGKHCGQARQVGAHRFGQRGLPAGRSGHRPDSPPDVRSSALNRDAM